MKPVDAIASAILITVSMLLGCAGRPAHPVMVYQHEDEARSCDALDRELELIEEEITERVPQTYKADNNTALGVTGLFLLVPLFFMDISKTEQIEINALIKRYNHLLKIAEINECSLVREPIPDFKKQNTD